MEAGFGIITRDFVCLLHPNFFPRTMSPEHPLSPHLQIYRLPLAALLSISHRIMGVLLTAATVALAFLIAAAAYAPSLWQVAMSVLQHPLGQILLIAWTFALAFHLCTGIRHLVWDACIGLSMPAVQASNWLVLAGSTTLTIAVWAWIWA